MVECLLVPDDCFFPNGKTTGMPFHYETPLRSRREVDNGINRP